MRAIVLDNKMFHKGSPRQKPWRVQKTLSTSKRVMDSFSHPFTIARKNGNW